MSQNGMLIFSTEFKKTVILRLEAGGRMLRAHQSERPS